MSATVPQDVPPAAQLLHLFFDSFILSRAISVAATLGIADLLASGAKTPDELAHATGVHAPSLNRVLRALASAGIFAADESGRVHLTPLAELLRSDTPVNWHAFANFLGSDLLYRAYGDILYSVQTGQPAFDHTFGKPLFAYLAEHPDQARMFNDAMTNTSQASAPAILAAYDFSRITRLVDIGGGHGFLLASILKAYPHMRGVLFDLPSVVAGAAPVLDAHGVSDRCECIGGDFSTSVPSGGDAYIMQAVLHGMPDEQALQLLRAIRQAMRDDGTVLQVDMVVPEGNGPSISKFGDVHMLIFTPSHERTEAEYRSLYQQAGFELTRVLPMPSVYNILEAKPI